MRFTDVEKKRKTLKKNQKFLKRCEAGRERMGGQRPQSAELGDGSSEKVCETMGGVWPRKV